MEHPEQAKRHWTPVDPIDRAMSLASPFSHSAPPTPMAPPVPDDNGFHMPNMEGKRLPNGYIEQGRVETPRSDSQQALETLGGLVSAPAQALFSAPRSTTDKVLQNVLPGGAALAAKRMLVDPQVHEWNRANETQGSESRGHRAASLLPVIGPMAAAAGESFGKKEYTAGGLNTIGALTAAHSAPEQIRSVASAIAKPSPLPSVNIAPPRGTTGAEFLADLKRKQAYSQSMPEALRDLESTYGLTESHLRSVADKSGVRLMNVEDTSLARNGLLIRVDDPQTGSTLNIRVKDAIDDFPAALDKARNEFKNPQVQPSSSIKLK